MERLIRLQQISYEFDRVNRELPGLSAADRQALIGQIAQLTREMNCLLSERRLRRFIEALILPASDS